MCLGDAEICPGPHMHILYSHKYTRIATLPNSTRGLCHATKQEGRCAELEHIKQQQPKKTKKQKVPFWQVQTTVKGNTNPFVCHLWCEEASPMDPYDMLRCSIESSTAVLATVVMSLSKTYSKGFFENMDGCMLFPKRWRVNLCRLYCEQLRLHGQRLYVRFGKCPNNHAGI